MNDRLSPAIRGLNGLGFLCALLCVLALCGCTSPGAHDLAGAVVPNEVVPASWPHEFRAPFAGEIVFAGKHIPAVGTIDFHTARDFRVTASAPDGKLLFDARYNWAGCHNLHRNALIPDNAVGSVCRDISLALTPPETAAGRHTKDAYDVTVRTDAQQRHYTYYFKRGSNQPEKVAVQLATWDTLTIHYRRFDGRGWPTKLVIQRPYRFYSFELTVEEGSETVVK